MSKLRTLVTGFLVVLLGIIGFIAVPAQATELPVALDNSVSTVTTDTSVVVRRISPRRFAAKTVVTVSVNTIGDSNVLTDTCSPNMRPFDVTSTVREVRRSVDRAKSARMVRHKVLKRQRVWREQAIERATQAAEAKNVDKAVAEARQACVAHRPELFTETPIPSELSLSDGPQTVDFTGSDVDGTPVDFSINDPATGDPETAFCDVADIDKAQLDGATWRLEFKVAPTQVGICIVTVYAVGSDGLRSDVVMERANVTE